MNPHARAGAAARHAGAVALTHGLSSARADTLATFGAYRSALGDALRVPQRGDMNPPLWELGHVGWFQMHFLGIEQPAAADALYDSSRVPHASRWALRLPDAEATQAALARHLEQALAALSGRAESDAGLYRHRLVLMHEDMHHEAALYMAQALDVPIGDPRWQASRLTTPRVELHHGAGPWRLGWHGGGFAFDNELGVHEAALGDTRIDSRVLTWAEYLPFVEATGAAPPRYLRRGGDGGAAWERRVHGAWVALDPALPACHLSLAEAEAWCAWAGRRLPTEAEWERAASLEAPGGPSFEWGAVWEWTASPFTPYPGFAPHLYADYSAPWFGTRQVLRGASFMTQPRLQNATYRNFFTPDRTDIAAGFRSCAGL